MKAAAPAQADSVAEGIGAFHREPAPVISNVSHSLIWIGDARKMDEFLAEMDPKETATVRGYEVLPDTRGVWHEYARQAWAFAERGDDDGVAGRINQMLKLAALYREFGGLQNVVQSEEIRYLAGRTVQELGYGGRIKSQYLEMNSQECMATIQRLAGAERGEVTPAFWQHLLAVSRQSFLRLAGNAPRQRVASTVSVR
ncbi:MAG TPA: hypothetical protein VGM54_21355 [Chthoniobacter sp.]